MKHGCKHITALLILLVTFCALDAQVNVRATTNRDSILIGEPIAITVEAYMPLGSKITWLVADSIPHFEITGRSVVDTAQNIDGKKVSQVLTVTSFDSGHWQMPPFEILVDDQPFYTDSVGISVGFAPFDPKDDYRDIKDIIEVSNTSMGYVPWMIAGLALLSLLLMLYLVIRRKQTVPVVRKSLVPQLTPYDEAMQQLKELAINRSDDVKAFYSGLGDIFRRYVFRQFGMSSFERTSEELILQLSKLNIPKDNFVSLAQTMRMGDFVKFAKYRPSETDDELNLNVIRTSIEVMDKRFIGAV